MGKSRAIVRLPILKTSVSSGLGPDRLPLLQPENCKTNKADTTEKNGIALPAIARGRRYKVWLAGVSTIFDKQKTQRRTIQSFDNATVYVIRQQVA